MRKRKCGPHGARWGSAEGYDTGVAKKEEICQEGKKEQLGVRVGKGAKCGMCGKDCGKGGGLKTHVENAHDIDYKVYSKCFHKCKETVFDEWFDIEQEGKNIRLNVRAFEVT